PYSRSARTDVKPHHQHSTTLLPYTTLFRSPGGAPIKRETECRSWYSDISIRTNACSSSKRNSASAFANSVLPTPVVPRNINDPIGRLASLDRHVSDGSHQRSLR